MSNPSWFAFGYFDPSVSVVFSFQRLSSISFVTVAVSVSFHVADSAACDENFDGNKPPNPDYLRNICPSLALE